MIFALGAYLLWGLFPAFFPLLEPATPLEIIAHRIIWTGVFMAAVLLVQGNWRQLRSISLAVWVRVTFAAVLIAANWLIYVIAVNTDHVADAALGYFINPLVNVALGFLFLSERLSKLQLLSLTIALLAVLWLTVLAGQPPIVALGLALSFGFYGLIKKRIPLPATVSLTAETLCLAPLALGYLVFLEATGTGSFGHISIAHTCLLLSAGVVTAIPLLLFGVAAQRIHLSTIGMLQYMTPTMQLLWAVFIVHETLSPARWLGFSFIWVAVALFFFDIFRRYRKPAVCK
ncbi:EamA family transporter RarD [Corynebacterium sp. HS2168-gen11]|uniref:EamA family transporter RarD n=1 Tax=Corynebacterium sp. HS2168-gen11 TaxID=2974027 RepID=UPI00216B636A|nr:EamA family transporter RarD [Corynebacterium sp. HS2168-gen11]MCS4536219.1 EamA family transporter RarD [Corynebacterium sp. HS2168-gen11]